MSGAGAPPGKPENGVDIHLFHGLKIVFENVVVNTL